MSPSSSPVRRLDETTQGGITMLTPDRTKASGLINTSQQVGGAVGLALLSTIAVSTTEDKLAGEALGQSALTNGLANAFWAGAAIAFAGLLVSIFLVRGRDLRAQGGGSARAGARGSSSRGGGVAAHRPNEREGSAMPGPTPAISIPQLRQTSTEQSRRREIPATTKTAQSSTEGSIAGPRRSSARPTPTTSHTDRARARDRGRARDPERRPRHPWTRHDRGSNGVDLRDLNGLEIDVEDRAASVGGGVTPAATRKPPRSMAWRRPSGIPARSGSAGSRSAEGSATSSASTASRSTTCTPPTS